MYSGGIHVLWSAVEADRVLVYWGPPREAEIEQHE